MKFKKYIFICIFLYVLSSFNFLNIYALNENNSTINYNTIEKQIKTPFGVHLYNPIKNFLNNNMETAVEKEVFISTGLEYLGISNSEKNTSEKNLLNQIYKDLCSEKILIEKYRNEKILKEIESRNNMLGRWTIPTINIDVAIFNSAKQEVVDKKDSAAYFKHGNTYVIADHVHQSNFKYLKNCKIGTKAYLDTGYEKKEYVCTASFPGHNTGKLLTDNNYNSIKDMNNNGIACYTCNGNSQNIWILFFQPV